MSDYAQFWGATGLSDVKLRLVSSSGEKTLDLHGIVLSAQSPYFHTNIQRTIDGDFGSGASNPVTRRTRVPKRSPTETTSVICLTEHVSLDEGAAAEEVLKFCYTRSFTDEIEIPTLIRMWLLSDR